MVCVTLWNCLYVYTLIVLYKPIQSAWFSSYLITCVIRLALSILPFLNMYRQLFKCYGSDTQIHVLA